MYKLSIIIPVYNAQKKIKKTISSILNQTMDLNDIEVIFVDDCSTDRSVDIIQTYCKQYENFKLYQLEENSGSPSKPRNYGIHKATANYVMFLDADDILKENACNLLYFEASTNNYDLVRGYIEVIREGNQISISNRLEQVHHATLSTSDLLSELVSKQSTTIEGIYNRYFLLNNSITFDENIRLGEDTLFLNRCYANTKKIQYIDECIYQYVKRDELNNVSSTQRYGSKELNDHLHVWRETRKILKKVGLDYYKLRVHIGVKTALESILNYSNGSLPNHDFNKFRDFLLENEFILSSMNLSARVQGILENILDGDYDSFVQNTKKRILINGYDLKFIRPLIPFLEKKYEIKIDEWKGHNIHDERQSRELLAWADIIFCEWLLGNAVWYSNNKSSDQLLLTRMHRFELFLDFANKVNFKNVDYFISVGLYYQEEFIREFNLPREKVFLIPNHVDVERFERPKTQNNIYNLALIGILPLRKRLDLAITILENLLIYDSKFKLHIIGSKPEEVPWLWNIESEKKYFEQVYKRINSNPTLQHAVIFSGWQDSSEYLKNIGFVLSVSDYDKPESFHLAPAEGMASGAIGLLLKWPGVEYIYPPEYTFDNIEEITKKILELSQDKGDFDLFSDQGKQFITESYSISKIADQMDILIQRGYLRKS
ncbi:glycosyltransferase [Paenibacillus dendritiformis]|uniref:Glycosyltransferase n=1 Tax=Paenibacillus dendritiformis C454 TaxID=1131935 RepID=H3S9M4_9BACL|nr:glycosyltransferase [Paenibacillus dendritiformis]EHQ64142.1 glycosyltransferase [Paenibacillus dendritiformis C454]CAH8767331.1 glycosyltransferase [Paenibacillus dendritiformis]